MCNGQNGWYICIYVVWLHSLRSQVIKRRASYKFCSSVWITSWSHEQVTNIMSLLNYAASYEITFMITEWIRLKYTMCCLMKNKWLGTGTSEDVKKMINCIYDDCDCVLVLVMCLRIWIYIDFNKTPFWKKRRFRQFPFTMNEMQFQSALLFLNRKCFNKQLQ